jgi:uncharacterized protein YjbI with pentapeptide repeats
VCAHTGVLSNHVPHHVDTERADLSGVSLASASLKGATFNNATLADASFTDAVCALCVRVCMCCDDKHA